MNSYCIFEIRLGFPPPPLFFVTFDEYEERVFRRIRKYAEYEVRLLEIKKFLKKNFRCCLEATCLN